MPSNFNMPYDQQFEDQNLEKQPNLKIPQGKPIIGGGVSSSFGEENIGLQFAPVGGFKEADQGMSVEDLQNIPENRATDQTGWELTGKALGQTATELTLGSLEALGYALDVPGIAESVLGVETEFDNKISKVIREAKEAINEKYFPIYQTKAALEGNFFDATSIASNFKNLASTATLMIPAIGAARGVALLGKIGEEARLMNLVRKGMSAEQAIAKDAKMIQTAQAVTAAGMSRHGEDTMESQQFMAQYKDKLTASLQPEAEQRAMARINELPMVVPFNPERTDNYTQEDRARDEKRILDEEKARLDSTVQSKVVEGARNVYKADGALLLTDVLQYIPLFSGLGTAAKALNIPKAGMAAFQIGSEAIEEGVQSANQLEAYNAISTATPFLGPGYSERFGEYLKDADLQTSMLWGAAGAGVFMGLGPAAKKAIEVGQDFNLNRARASQMGDIHTFNKLTDDAKNALIKNHARRDRLDKLDEEMQSLKTQFDEQDWAEAGMSKEQAEKFIDDFSEDITYAKEQKQIVDNTEFFQGKDAAKVDYLESLLTHRSNARVMKANKEETEQIFSDLTQKEEIPPELSKEKRMLIEIEALKNFQKNLKKIPSLAKNEALRSKVSNNITLKLTGLKANLDEVLKAYEVMNPGVNAKEALISPSDPRLIKNRQDYLELETIQNNVLKPRIEAYKSKAFIEEKDAEIKTKEKTAKKATAKAAAKEATTPEEVKEAKKVAKDDPEVTEEVTKTIEEAAGEQMKTAPKRLSERYAEAPHLFEDEQDKLFTHLVGKYNGQFTKGVENEVEGLLASATPQEFVKNIGYIMDQSDSGNPVMKELYSHIEEFFKDKFEMQDAITKTVPEQSEDVFVVENAEPEVTETIESLKADIEKRRNDELKGKKFIPVDEFYLRKGDILYNLYYNTEDVANTYTVKAFSAGGKDMNQYLKGVLMVDNETQKENWWNSSDKFNWNNLFKKADIGKINAKYDAELAALEAAEDEEEPIVESTEGSSDIDYDELDRLLPSQPQSGIKPLLAKMRKFVITTTGRIKKIDSVEKIESNLDKYGKEMKIDFPYVQSTKSLQEGSEVYFVVNTDIAFDKQNLDDYHKNDIGKFGSDEYVNKYQVLIAQKDKSGEEHIINALPIYDGSESPEMINLMKLRQDIFSKVMASKQKTGTFNSNIYTKVTKKYPGRLVTTKARNNPADVLSNGQKLIFGIAMTKGTKTTIEVGKNVEDTRYHSLPINPKHAGKIFMLIEGANGKIVPAMCFTKNIDQKGFEKERAIVLKKLAETNASNWVANRKAVNDIIGMKYFYIPAEDVFKDANGNKFNKTQLEQMIAGRVLNVRSSMINLGNYNKLVSNSGRLSVDLLAGENIANANFEFSSEYYPKEAVAQVETIEAPVIPAVEDRVDLEQPEVITETPATESDELHDFDGFDLGNLGDIRLRIATVSEQEFYQKWDKAKEEKWFKDRFGTDKDTLFSIKEGLIEINKNGGINAWGQFKDAIAYISSVAATGTTYHEAFHVVFHLYLNDKQRSQILAEGRKEGLSDIEIEESIADRFMEYVQSEETDTKGLGVKIKAFFKRLYQIIKSGMTNDITINDLFYRAQHKMYKNKPFTRDISNFNITRNRVKGLSVYQEQRRTIALADEMRKVVDKIIELRPDLASLPRIEVVKALSKADKTGKSSGVDMLLKTAYNSIKKELTDNKELTDEQRAGLKFMLNRFISPNQDGTINLGELGVKAVRQFAKTEGVSISTTSRDIKSFKDVTEDEAEDFGEEQTKAEGWQTKAEEMSGKESLSKEVRKILSYIPVLKNNTKQAAEAKEFQKDDLDFVIYNDFNMIYGYLKRELSGIIDADDMLDRLSQIAAEKPYLAQILGDVRKNDLLRTKFFVDFAKSHVDLKTIKEESVEDENGNKTGTRVKIISSNRVMVFRMLVDEWKMNSKDPNLNKVLNADKTINPERAAKVAAALESFKMKNRSVSIYDTQALKDIVAISKYIGLTIKLDDLTSLNTDRKFINEDGELRTQSGKSKVDNLFNKIDTLISTYSAGKDPFDASTSESRTIDEISRIISKFRQEMMESSFRTRRGKETKTIYSHQVPAFLARQINEFKSTGWKEKIQYYIETPFYGQLNKDGKYEALSPWLKDLGEFANREALEFVEIDNLQYASENNDSDSIPYVDMSDKDYEFTSINMYFNNGGDSVYYRFPVVSDAPKMLFIRFKRYEGKDVLESLYKVYQQEQARIDDVKSREKQRADLVAANMPIPDELLPIEHYDTEKSKKFLLLPFLNNSKTGARAVGSKDKTQIKQAIKDWLVAERDADYGRLQTIGVLQSDVKDVQLDDRIYQKYAGNTSANLTVEQIEAAQKAFHSDYFYNTIIANTQMTTLFSGDPAFYKADRTSRSIYSRTVDFQKRNKQNVSPALRIDPSAVYHFTEEQAAIEGKPFETVGDNYNSIYLKDLKIPSSNAKMILDTLLANGVPEGDAYSIAAQYGYTNKWQVVIDENKLISEYFNNKVDALEFAKAENLKVNEYAYVKVGDLDFNFKSSTINVTDAQAYITPQRFRRVMIGLGRWTKQYQDIYPKMLKGTLSGEELQVVMQPMKPFYFGHTRVGNLLVPTQNKNSEFLLLPQLVKNSPELTKLYNFMVDPKHPIDSANFETAVKVGAFGVQSIDNIEKASIHQLNNKDYGLQQETPEHYLDARTLFGTQIRKLIMADISDDAMFDVPWSDKQMTKRELFNLYQDIIVEDLREAFAKTDNRVKDLESIEKLLLEEIQSREMGEELEKAVRLVPTTDEFGNSTKEFVLPLFHPLHARRIESLLNSVFKNSITKQKINGGAFVQLSSFGFTDKLKLNIEDGRLVSAECMLPWWSKKHFEPLLDASGNLDINKVPANLLEMIGYRIPTEDKYSMLPLKVVGFMPANSGGAVMLPMEITTISGSDFDIDKLYVMIPEFDAIGKDIVKVKYDAKKSVAENSTKARNNAKIDIIRSVLTNKDTFRKFINPGGFSRLAEEAKVIKTAEGKIDEMLPLVLPSTQTELFRRNMTGKQLVGIFASHNANHAVLQYSNVALVAPVEFDGNSRRSLHDVYDTEGNYVSKNVAEFLAAVVDNAKDPLSSFINLNTYSADVAAVMLRVGYPISTTVRFLSQPILKEFVSRYFNGGASTQSEKEAIKFIETKYGEFEGKELKPTFGKSSPSDAELLSEVEKGGTTNDNQLWMFRQFMSLKEKGQSMTSLVSAMRADTKGVGPTLSENEALLANIDSTVKDTKITGQAELFYGNIIGPLVNADMAPPNQGRIFEVLDKYFKTGTEVSFFNRETNKYDTAEIAEPLFGKKTFDGFAVTGTDNIGSVIDILDISIIGSRSMQELIELDNPYKMISGFTTYGVDLPTKSLAKFFPWFNKSFKFAKSQLASYTKAGRLNVEQIERINYAALTYIASGFEFFNGSDRAEVTNNISEQFKSLKEANSDLFENNFFLNKLLVEDTTDPQLPRRVVFKNTGSLTNQDKQQVSESWEEALESPALGKFARDLIKYSYYTSGFSVTPNSFWHLVPVEFFSNLTDSVTKQTFNQYLSKKIAESNQNEYQLSEFINQFILNNYNDPAFVWQVNKKFNNITGQVVLSKSGTPAYFQINAKDKNIKDKGLFKLALDKKSAVFPEYLSYKKKDKTYLFKHSSQSSDLVAIYVLEERLGSPNNFVEYSYNSAVKSVLDKNNHFKGKFTQDGLEAFAVKQVFGEGRVIEQAEEKPVVVKPIEPLQSEKNDVSLDEDDMAKFNQFKGKLALMELTDTQTQIIKDANVDISKLEPTKENLGLLRKLLC